MCVGLAVKSVACATVLSLDATDISGEHSAGGGYANNGEIHKIRVDAGGRAIGLGEYIPPRRFGFMLGKPREVLSGSLRMPWLCSL